MSCRRKTHPRTHIVNNNNDVLSDEGQRAEWIERQFISLVLKLMIYKGLLRPQRQRPEQEALHHYTVSCLRHLPLSIRAGFRFHPNPDRAA